MKRNVFLLAFCQALMIIGNSLLLATSALVGQRLAQDGSLATVPLGLQFLAAMLSTFPASLLMKRIGRRGGFLLSALLGISGASVCTYAIFQNDFVSFCIGAVALGVFNGFGQFYRFAAADVASDAYRSRAISWVLAGGVIAAFIGPNLAAWTRDSFPTPFAGSYGALIGVYLISLTVMALLRIPPPTEQERYGAARPLIVIMQQPAFIVAVLGAMLGYGVMNLVMTATPLAMHAHEHTFPATAFVIQWHVLGMFVPSFFTGHLIRRFGVLNIMLIGGVLLVACVAVNLVDRGLWHFWTALVLLGIGWNFLFIGGTTLLTETYLPAEKAKTQALNDFIVFATVTLTAFSSGAVHYRFGWQAINIGVIPLIVVTMTATAWLRWRRQESMTIQV